MKTAVVYARYSSNNQTEQSIEGQLHVCEDFARRNNILIVDSYIDRAMSGTNDERDSFQKMLKDSNNKKWDYVLVYKLDRFARNKYESAIHRKHLKDNGTKLISAMENIPETPEGVLLESLLEGMNQYFSEELAQKVSRGLHESRTKGHCIGSVPYGYIKQKDKTLTINEEESIILKKIFELYSSGKTILQISRDFERENITMKGRKFIPDTLRDILQRKSYTGIYEINGKEYNNMYPQIISIDLFNKTTERLNKTRYGCRKDNHATFRIKDKILCGYCNRKMYPVTAKSFNGNTIRFYKCISGRKNDCQVSLIYKDFIEGIIDKFLIQQFKIPENLDKICTQLYEASKRKISKNISLSVLKADLQKTNTAISNMLIAIEKGIITSTTKQRLEELETTKKYLEEKIVIEESKQQFELTKDMLKEMFTQTIKQSPDRAIELFIRFVKVYKDKIEIGLNATQNTAVNSEQTTKKIFTETFTQERHYKGGKTKIHAQNFDVYVVI